jgi:uncharacterized repeat protein (TIGR01451 family)
MKRLNLKNLWTCTALACALAFGLAGCGAPSTQTQSYDNKGTSYWASEGGPKPAPVTPAPAPVKPAPAPAPAPAPVGMVCSNLYYPTGDKATSAVWLQKCLPGEVAVGETFVSEIKVTNLTSLGLTDVVVTDALPEGYELASTDPVTESAAGAKLQWRFSKLDPMASKTIKVTGKATKVGTLANCATVSYNTVLCVETKVVQPALALAKTLTPEALACDPIIMTLKVTNSGSGPAKDVKIADKLPEGLMTKDGKKEVAIDVGTLAAGQSKDFTVELKAAGAGKYDNAASATAAGGLSAMANASTVVKKPVLKIVQDCPKKVFIGRDICHDITVSNTGDGVSKGTKVVATLPAGVNFVSATDGGTNAAGTVTWNVGDLAAGATKKITVCLKPAKDGTYKVAAAAQGYCAEAVSSTCETVVEGIPAILLEVIDIEDPVAVGTNTTYIITATNQGSAVGKDVKVVVTLEDNAELVNTDGSATKGTAAAKVITFDALPALGVGAKASWKVVVKAVKAGDVRFKVSMTEAQLGRPVEETEATNFYDSK